MIDPGLFKTAVVRQTYDYWLSKCSGDRLPHRADLKPAEMRRLLPYVFLVDVTHAPLGFRFRLVGSRITDWAEREYTGRAVDEREYGPHWQRVFDMYASVVATRGPRRDIYTAPWVSREFYHYERFVAPLSNDGTTIDMLFGALHTLPSDQV